MLRNINCGKALQSLVLLCLVVFTGCDQRLSPEEGMQRADTYRDNGDYDAAIIELRNVLRNSPQHSETRLKLSELYILQRDGLSAAAQLDKVREFGQGEIDIRLSLGRALLLQREYDKLLLETVIEEDDSTDIKTDLLLLRAYAYFYKNDLEQADRLFMEVQAANKRSSAALVGLALVNLENKNYEGSGRQVEQALAIDAGNIDAWLIKGRLELIQKQYEKAKEAFGRSINYEGGGFSLLNPMQAHIYLVQSLIEQKKMKEARQTVDQFAKKHPKNTMLHYLRAQIAYEDGVFDKASEHIQVIRSVAPGYDMALLLEGAINYELGSYERANIALTSYLSSHPGSATARKLLAVTKLKLREPEQAFELVSPLLSQDPGNQQLLLLGGSAMRDAGKPEVSIPMLKKASQQDPDNVELKMQLASAHISNKETDKAIVILQSLTPTVDKFGKRELLMLLAWSQKQDYVAALAFVDDYIATHPQDPDVYGHSGVILLRMGNVDAAQKRFEKSLSLKPDNKLILMTLVRLEYQQKNYLRAEELLVRLLKMQPGNASIMYALANVTALKGDANEAIKWLESARQTSTKVLEPRLVLIKYYLERGDINKASDIGKEVTKIAPERADVWNTYSVVQKKMGDSQGAVKSLLMAESLKPDSKTILMNLARSQMGVGDIDGASLTLRKLLKLSPDNFQAASMLALIEIKKGNVQLAFDIAEKQQIYKENRLNALALEGDLYTITGKHHLAVYVYKKAVEISPSTALIVKLYSATTRAALPEAENLLLSWLQKHSDDTAIRLLLAGHYETTGDLGRAIKEYETLIIQKPNDADILNNLAIVYHLNNNSKAVQAAEKAYKLNTESAAIKDTLGWILVQENDVKRGLPLLRDAMAELPGNMEVQYHYAVALDKSGDSSGARSLLQKLVDSKSNFPALEDAKKYLQKLES